MVARRPMANGIDNGSNRQWHVNRGIPVVFIISMFFYAVVQAALFGWYASAIDKRVETIERTQLTNAPIPERLTRVEEKLVGVQSGVTRIEAILTKPAR